MSMFASVTDLLWSVEELHEATPMLKQINIMLQCERLDADGPWRPGFAILFVEGNVAHETPKFYARDIHLTFPTRRQSEEWSESAAREWCEERYPEYSIVGPNSVWKYDPVGPDAYPTRLDSKGNFWTPLYRR